MSEGKEGECQKYEYYKQKHAERCPVCYGKGFVAEGYYKHFGDYWIGTGYMTPETCRGCGGKGWVEV